MVTVSDELLNVFQITIRYLNQTASFRFNDRQTCRFLCPDEKAMDSSRTKVEDK